MGIDNRPIKFRGRDIETNEYRYGLYFEDAAIQDGNCVYLVVRGSIVQLVGYDANGDELYEGDTLVLINGAGEEVMKNIVRPLPCFNPSCFYFEENDVRFGSLYKKV